MKSEKILTSANPATPVETINSCERKANNTIDSISVFNFKENWHLIQPHLNDPEIIELQSEGMRKYCKGDEDHCGSNLDWDKDGHKGAWLFTASDRWFHEIEKRFMQSKELSDLHTKFAILAEEVGIDFNEILCSDSRDLPNDSIGSDYWKEWHELYDSFHPQPDTYEWYQCFNAEKHLASWQKALAEKMFPYHKWTMYEMQGLDWDENFPLIGVGPDGKILIFDIFTFEFLTVAEILQRTGVLKLNLAA